MGTEKQSLWRRMLTYVGSVIAAAAVLFILRGHDVGAGDPVTKPPMGTEKRSLWRNTLTYVGSALAAGAVLFITSFFFFDLVTSEASPYLGLFTYLILPGFLVLGIILILIGLWLKRRQVKREQGSLEGTTYYPRIDLSLRHHRRALVIVGLVVLGALPFIGTMSYYGYHYTDSNRFCGLVCHRIMDPQYVAHEDSSHARVECAECHIGPGASWYVKSKLSGLQQVYATLTNTYPRPIPPAIQDLRPATVTCEQCHWPAKFFGDQLVTMHHFSSDEKNTPSVIRMFVKTGGANPTTGPPSGIHWHMALGETIEFVAVDKALQEIPWVRETNHATKKQTIYRSDGLSSTAPPPEGIKRTVDCMDCHNRATHVFRAPTDAADDVLSVNTALRTLPYAKREMVAALVRPYKSHEDGAKAIAKMLNNYYQSKHPQVASGRAGDVKKLIAQTQRIFRHSFFPDMRVTWRTYANNVGHLMFAGCFRCHDGKHVSADGKVISRNCSACHVFLERANPSETQPLLREGSFTHPIALKGEHATMNCDRCHTGGVAPAKTCAGCHSDIAEFQAGTLAAFKPFNISAEPMYGLVGCEECHDLSKPLNAKTINEACFQCHDKETMGGKVAAWQAEADRLFKAAAAKATKKQKKLIEELHKVGPLHNMDATRKILESIARGGPATEPATKPAGAS